MSEQNKKKDEKKAYKKELKFLQIELLKLQSYVKSKNEKILIILEGRDAAGKGGTIKRITQHLNPRGCIVVALPKPSDVEATEWYFQRYVKHLPSAGEIVIFDRSWYNRAMVEPVMGFCTAKQSADFLQDVNQFESLIKSSGIKIFKFFLSITKKTQEEHFQKRYENPLKRYKISPIDQKAQELWYEYNKAERDMLLHTSSIANPWIVVDANNKHKTHINVIKKILFELEYDNKASKKELTPSNKVIVNIEDEILNLENEIAKNEEKK